MDRDRSIGQANLDRHIMVLDQRTDLFQKVGSIEFRLRDRGLVASRAGHMAIGKARIHFRVRLRCQPYKRIKSPHLPIPRPFLGLFAQGIHVLVERLAQTRRLIIV